MNLNKLLVSLAVNLSIIVVLAIGLILLGSILSKQAATISQLRNELNSRLFNAESLTILRQESAMVKTYSGELNRRLVNRLQLLNFPQDLNIIATQNQVDSIAALGNESPRAGEELGKVDFTAAGGGTLDKLTQFLKVLEEGRYFYKITTLDIGKEENKFKFRLSGQVFYF